MKTEHALTHTNAFRKTVQTPSGTIAYVERGTGPVALFVQGVLLNGHLWRHQLEHLQGTRRCIAVDLLAHGETQIEPHQDVSVTANAVMLRQFLDALGIDKVDLVGNDSGGGIAQIFAGNSPERVRSLALTDCDVHDTWPPEAFKPFLAMSAAGGLSGALDKMVSEKAFYRSADALGPAYEHPESVSDDTTDTYLQPFRRSPRRLRDLERVLAAFDCAHTVAVEEKLRALRAPTLIVWGTDDVYFPTAGADWLERTIPGVRRRVDIEGARLFLPEERASQLNEELLAHWRASS